MSIKTPLFQASTFIFESSAAAERLFDITYGGAPLEEGEEPGYIYTRLDHPNLVVVEERLAHWDGADGALLFSSGTAAVFTMALTVLQPGDLILHSAPLYGGTNTIFESVLKPLGFDAQSFGPDATEDDLNRLVGDRRLGLMYLETPANPTNDVFDIAMAARLAQSHSEDSRKVTTVVDNTFLGPFSQRPLEHGADLAIYSATKYYGGHSDIISGVAAGRSELIEPLKTMRYRIGTTADPHSAWLLGRSLETYALRVERQTSSAGHVARYLADHSKTENVKYLGLESDNPLSHQWKTPGAMVVFEVVGGKEPAFRFLDAMELIGLTTSLGGTETIACHPWTSTHSNVHVEARRAMGVTEGLIRLSIGVEAVEDIIADLDQALAQA